MNDIRYTEIAKACGLYGSEPFMRDVLEFAYQVAADEREACAKLLDEMAAQDHYTNYYQVAAKEIRARGEK